MKLEFDSSLAFQHDAINAVINTFDGQALSQSGVTAFQTLQIGPRGSYPTFPDSSPGRKTR